MAAGDDQILRDYFPADADERTLVDDVSKALTGTVGDDFIRIELRGFLTGEEAAASIRSARTGWCRRATSPRRSPR